MPKNIQVKMILNGIILAGRVFLSCVQRTLQAKGKVMTLNLRRGFYFPFFSACEERFLVSLIFDPQQQYQLQFLFRQNSNQSVKRTFIHVSNSAEL